MSVEINKKELLNAVKLINESGLLEKKVKTVGEEIGVLADFFMKAVETIPVEKEGKIPEPVVVFYNGLNEAIDAVAKAEKAEIEEVVSEEIAPEPVPEKKAVKGKKKEIAPEPVKKDKKKEIAPEPVPEKKATKAELKAQLLEDGKKKKAERLKQEEDAKITPIFGKENKLPKGGVGGQTGHANPSNLKNICRALMTKKLSEKEIKEKLAQIYLDRGDGEAYARKRAVAIFGDISNEFRGAFPAKRAKP